jgi:hypothetical protein
LAVIAVIQVDESVVFDHDGFVDGKDSAVEEPRSNAQVGSARRQRFLDVLFGIGAAQCPKRCFDVAQAGEGV